MGSIIEINDTLKLKRGEQFPDNIAIGGIYKFKLDDRRLFHMKPVRVFLVEEVDGYWNYIGHVMIVKQTIDAIKNETKGVYEVVALYPEEYAKLANEFESPKGKGYSRPWTQLYGQPEQRVKL
ncbi:MAG: hypothetical protein GY797_39335 [Deltaproteobacteria bacterium]|nr:hypothetical protein [Deltaproteobacteria bacterium]